MNDEQEQQQGERTRPQQGSQEDLMKSPPDIINYLSISVGVHNNGIKITDPSQQQGEQETPKRKYYLTAEQQRVCDVLAEYERAYISVSSREGNWMVLNGDKTERVRSNTLTALVKKGYLGENGRNRLKLI